VPKPNASSINLKATLYVLHLEVIEGTLAPSFDPTSNASRLVEKIRRQLLESEVWAWSTVPCM